VDIAVDPVDGTTLTAKALPDALAVIAVAERGAMFDPGPCVYMEKLAVAGDVIHAVDIEAPIEDNLAIIAGARRKRPDDITVAILDRPRHADLVASVRKAGASVRFITDGDVAGVIHTTEPDVTGIDIYLGVGGAPEGVLAAAALRCLGAEIIGRLRFRSDEERARAKKMGIADESRIYRTEDLASGNDIRFVATGVTDGDLLKGVHFFARGARTHSILLDRLMGKLRFIDTTHFEDIDHPPLIRLE
jgi:fructose-1,6-bisphosphatase II